MAKICGDDLEMQTALLKQTKEELLAIYRDSLIMFLSTTGMLDDLRNMVVINSNVPELYDEDLYARLEKPDWKNRDAVAKVCGDDLEMQIALLKQAEE